MRSPTNWKAIAPLEKAVTGGGAVDAHPAGSRTVQLGRSKDNVFNLSSLFCPLRDIVD